MSDDFWGKSNLQNLASPFDKFIEKKYLENSNINNDMNINNNNEDNINNYVDNNNDEFNDNWFEYF